MISLRWLVAIPVILGAAFLAPSSEGAAVRDGAGVFSKDAVKKAVSRLERLERATHIPIVIETIDAVPGIDPDATPAQRRKAAEALAVHRAEAIRDEGIYILIAKREHTIPVLVRDRFAQVLPIDKRDAIREAFRVEFRKDDYDAGLLSAVATLEHALDGVTAGKRGAHVVVSPEPLRDHAAGAAPRRAARSGFGSFLLIILGIFGVLLFLRVLGGLFGRCAGPGYGAPMGGMPRAGVGPGPGYYGGPGYGGGGGFFSGLLGGLGGALAGNWLYDQFSGRHHGMTSADAGYAPDDTSAAPDTGGDAIVGADDDIGGGGATWDDAPGTDAGGGDGGDWGGGGGDWGGGGGDWGGGGGGGDW